MMKTLLYAMVVTFLLTGCSIKIYNAPSIDFKLKDKSRESSIPDAELRINFLPVETILARSNSEGNVLFEGDYERRWHMYPFPIISHGALMKSHFILSHPKYNRYELSCSYLTLIGKCFDIKIKKLETHKRDMSFECEGCSNE